MWTQFFTMIFLAINHWLGVDVVETGDEFSVICISLSVLWIIYIQSSIIFLILFFIVTMKKKAIQGLVFRISNIKKTKTKYSHSYFFKFVFMEQS